MLLDDLKRHIEVRDVVVIAGTGVSIQATNNAPCASWLGLIRDGLDHAVDLGRLSRADAESTKRALTRRAKDLDFLLSTAHDITAKLGAQFDAWLQKRVGALHALNREVIEALARLGAIIATTNYDHLITEVTGLPPVPWTDSARVEDVLRGTTRGVLHLHGSYDAPKSVIFDIRSYDRLLQSEHAQAVLTTLRTSKTLLFVGCGDGLRDPHFATFLKWTEKAFEQSRYPHFILCRKKEVSALRKEHLPERQLHPIAYGKDFGELPEFLRSLVPPPAAPAPVPAAAPRSRVFPAPGPCFGRDVEVRTVVDALLGEPAARLAILGTGGLGKTTLTLQALHDERVQARFGDAIFFVRCDPATNIDGLLTAIATELHISGTPHLRDAILGTLAIRPSVLVLDNFETPYTSATLDVEELLASLAGIDSLHLVVTMRGKERPAGVLWRDPLEPPLLSLPAARDAFLAVAGSKFKDDLRLDELLEAMDRLPLGVTLMAYLAQSEAHLDVLLDRWRKKRTAMLQRAGGKVKATNIEVSFDMSIDSPRVTPNARRLLSMLATLPGGIAHEDLTALLDDGDEAAAVLRATGLAFDEGNRLRMLTPLRAYVVGRYPPAPEDNRALIQHYLELNIRCFDIGGREGHESLQRVAPEVANLEWVIDHVIEKAPSNELEPAVHGYSFLVDYTGLGSRIRLQRVAEAAEKSSSAALQATALEDSARIAANRGELAVARVQIQAALSLREKHGSKRQRAWAITIFGAVLLRLNDLETAEQQYRTALDLFRALDDKEGQANSLRALGDVAFRKKKFDEAQSYYDEALPLAQETEELRTEASCLRMIGGLLLRKGDSDGAKSRYYEALALSERAADVYVQANCHWSLGHMFEALGEHENAIDSYGTALRLFTLVGDDLAIAELKERLAILSP